MELRVDFGKKPGRVFSRETVLEREGYLFMNLCKDCKWAKAPRDLLLRPKWREAVCKLKPAQTFVDPVHGTQSHVYARCSTERHSFAESACGPEGKSWEPKKA